MSAELSPPNYLFSSSFSPCGVFRKPRTTGPRPAELAPGGGGVDQAVRPGGAGVDSAEEPHWSATATFAGESMAARDFRCRNSPIDPKTATAARKSFE